MERAAHGGRLDDACDEGCAALALADSSDVARLPTLNLIATALAQSDFNSGMDLLEREMLARLYPDYPSSRKLADRLGVSHTSIANKLRKYGIGN